MTFTSAESGVDPTDSFKVHVTDRNGCLAETAV